MAVGITVGCLALLGGIGAAIGITIYFLRKNSTDKPTINKKPPNREPPRPPQNKEKEDDPYYSSVYGGNPYMNAVKT